MAAQQNVEADANLAALDFRSLTLIRWADLHMLTKSFRDTLRRKLEARFPDLSIPNADQPDLVAEFAAKNSLVGHATVWDNDTDAMIVVGEITHFHVDHLTRHTMITHARRGGALADVLERVTHNAKGSIIDQYTHFDWEPLCEAVGCLNYSPKPSALAEASSPQPALAPAVAVAETQTAAKLAAVMSRLVSCLPKQAKNTRYFSGGAGN